MKILVFGGWFGSGNIGDDAILIGIRDVMKKVIPDVELKALSMNPENTRQLCGVETIKLQSPRQVLRNKSEYFNAFHEADAVIVSGGTPIYDYDHLSRMIHMGLPILNRKPLILFGIGAKPVNTVSGRSVLRILLRNAQLISVRDYPSAGVLSKVTEKQITVTGDSALCINDLDRVTKTGEQVAVICPRALSTENKPLYHERVSIQEIEKIRRAIARAADSLSNTHRVIFIPFHTVHVDDDRNEITKIEKLMKTHDFVTLDKPLSPEHAFRIVSEADILIGLRLHSLVLGALADVPLVSISYDTKIRGFMEAMGLGHYTCHLDNLLPNTIREKVSLGLNQSQEIKQILEYSLKKKKESIMCEAIRVAELLSSLK